MAAQALEYERAHNSQLQPFFDSSIPHIRHTEVREWGGHLLREREEMRAEAKHQRDNQRHYMFDLNTRLYARKLYSGVLLFGLK